MDPDDVHLSDTVLDIMAMEHREAVEAFLNADFETDPPPTASEAMEDDTPKFGCRHYECKCRCVAPCCDKVYPCRLCHDEEENHQLDPRKIMEVICVDCQLRQPVGKLCAGCDVEFGLYFCAICRVYDDAKKKQFHCDKCGVCRVGGKDRYFHCPKCDMCLHVRLKKYHHCIPRVARSECPVCNTDNLQTTTRPLHVVPCGHIFHRHCWKIMVKSGNYDCPACGEPVVDLAIHWDHLDEQIAKTPMTGDNKDKRVWIHCRDCSRDLEVKFHTIGLKCTFCNSYNTRDLNPSEPTPSTSAMPFSLH